MSIPGAGNPLLLGGAGAYKIERSLRFNSADSASLSRTPASAGNRRTWTWAGWLKRSNVTSIEVLWSAGADGSNYELLYFSSGQLYFASISGGSVQTDLFGTPFYRDPSAWYHIILSADTTQAVANDRIKIYVNGSLMSSVLFAAPPLNYQYFTNNTGIHRIGGRSYDNTSGLNGYLVDVYLIDGQALTPSSFGEFDDNGIWQPKAFSGGTYGTNGFKLAFADNSAATATTLGKDTSGNGNNWTPNNLSVTAGAGNDSLVDSPTNYGTDTGAGGEVRGNYATLNPLIRGASTTLSNGNLDVAFSGWNTSFGTVLIPTSGKWFFEVNVATTEPLIGIARATENLLSAAATYFSNPVTSYSYYATGAKALGPGNTQSTYGAAYTSGDVAGVAFDADAGTIVFYKNGVSQGTAFTGITGQYVAAIGASGGSFSINFGQRPFSYTAPSGFKALCTQNLPAPTITKPSTVMDVLTWSGTGGSRSFSGLNFSPDLVWSKQRSGGGNHQLYDSVRGAGSTKDLSSSLTVTEGSATTGASVYGYLSSFDANGFSTLGGTDPTYPNGYWNDGSTTYVAWTWDAGSSTVTNTSGTISSQVRANPSAGFSIVTFSASSPTNSTVGHGLGVQPSLLIVKARTNPGAFYNDWLVYHSSQPTRYHVLSGSGASGFMGSPGWGTINSSVFGVTNSLFATGDYVVYCFAPVASYSAFGSYTGNGNADGPFVYTGFRPRYVMVKSSSTGGTGYDWIIKDTERGTINTVTNFLIANGAQQENYRSDSTLITDLYFDFLSNGFKVRTNRAAVNGSTVTFIYAAFAEHPFALARAR